MLTTTTIHPTNETRPTTEFLVSDTRRFVCLSIGDKYGSRVDILCDPEFLDRLANECERAVREFVGDVPAPSQEYLDGPGELQAAEALR